MLDDWTNFYLPLHKNRLIYCDGIIILLGSDDYLDRSLDLSSRADELESRHTRRQVWKSAGRVRRCGFRRPLRGFIHSPPANSRSVKTPTA